MRFYYNADANEIFFLQKLFFWQKMTLYKHSKINTVTFFQNTFLTVFHANFAQLIWTAAFSEPPLLLFSGAQTNFFQN